MVYHNPESVLDNEIHKLHRNFETKIDHQISARRPDLIIINEKKKKENFQNYGLFFTADHRVKLKECKKRDKYLDLARELKKMWNMKVTIIQTVIGALCKVNQGLIQELEDLKI